jgi:uncharacterized protein (TIGR03067 family)
MKAMILLTATLLALPFTQAADDKNFSIEGSYTLVSGKRFGASIDEESKKGRYTIDKDRITIVAKGVKFVMSYKLPPKTRPTAIDMEILEGPEGTVGAKALGIVERTGDTLKLAYLLEKDRRPKSFEGNDGMLFIFKAKEK